MIYLDNAATSYPKPPAVITAMQNYLENVGASPGRSGHQLAAAAGRILFQTRKAVTQLLGLTDPGRIIFTQNATAALNLALFGLLRSGDRVLTSGLEHNAVMRPLRRLEELHSITIDTLPGNETSHYDLKILAQWCEQRKYRMAIINHASNVSGSLAPLSAILPILREHSIISVIDGAQSAGVRPLDLRALDPDIFCFTGHKSLYGPPGTGGLYLREGIAPEPLLYGGTGSRSEEEYQPDFLPDKYESGTPNTSGLAGLKAGLEFIRQKGLPNIIEHENELAASLRDGLATIPGLKLHEARPEEEQLAVISLTIKDLSPSEIGHRLDREFAIMTRVGLHCAPRAHQSIGTFPQGTVRLAPGYFNQIAEMTEVVRALAIIAGGHRD
ncbi:MAG: aminotransferase class V-fold PLP-dependent enzyme [Deltaproteobacteria bacterium]|nr:aminotransferase class V-fold PLP-dependent enzyme [Deltaproteobacteria bacterium]